MDDMPLDPELEEAMDRCFMSYASAISAVQRCSLAAVDAGQSIRNFVRAYWRSAVN